MLKLDWKVFIISLIVVAVSYFLLDKLSLILYPMLLPEYFCYNLEKAEYCAKDDRGMWAWFMERAVSTLVLPTLAYAIGIIFYFKITKKESINDVLELAIIFGFVGGLFLNLIILFSGINLLSGVYRLQINALAIVIVSVSLLINLILAVIGALLAHFAGRALRIFSN